MLGFVFSGSRVRTYAQTAVVFLSHSRQVLKKPNTDEDNGRLFSVLLKLSENSSQRLRSKLNVWNLTKSELDQLTNILVDTGLSQKDMRLLSLLVNEVPRETPWRLLEDEPITRFVIIVRTSENFVMQKTCKSKTSLYIRSVPLKHISGF